MQHEVKGGTTPILEITLSPGDELIAESGELAWMHGPVQLDEPVDEAPDVVERERPQRMTREHHLLPRRQLREDLLLELARPPLEAPHLDLERAAAEPLQLGDLVLELDDRLLELERLARVDHRGHGALIAHAARPLLAV